MVHGIDRTREAAVPGHEQTAVLADRLDDTAVTHGQLSTLARGREQLDTVPHANTRTDAGCQVAGSGGVHVRCIGRNGGVLDRGERRTAGAGRTASKREQPTGPSEFDGLDGSVGQGSRRRAKGKRDVGSTARRQGMGALA